MLHQVLRTVVVLVVTSGVREVNTQCLTQNDSMTGPLNPDLSGLSDLGFSLYREMAPAGNFFFSPYSIWSALGLTYLGSDGNTERQLRQALGVTDKINTYKVISALGSLSNRREARGASFTFKAANRIYYNTNLSLRPCVRSFLQRHLLPLDMTHTTAAAATVNHFIANTTNNRIQNVVSSDDLLDAQMVLVNAVFFKGTWRYQFKAKQTSPMTFNAFSQSPSSAALVPMMRQEGVMKYGESTNLGARILELPYSGNVISMFLLLPEREGTAAWSKMVDRLSAGRLQRAMSSTSRRTVELLLPKFKMETKVDNELIQGLKNMGVVDLFDSNFVNLTKFARRELVVSKTIHKAFVEVSEEGTEAAAATVVVAVTRSGNSRVPLPIPFHCTRPFMFVIMDNQTKNLMFIGAYKNPRT